MATYTIIGGDGKQYGPITAEEVGRWVSQGRLNAHSQAKAESDAEFRPLSTFPEFADLLGINVATPGVPPAFQAGTGTREPALQQVKGPAIALKVTAILGLICVAIGFVFNLWTLAGGHLVNQQFGDPHMEKLFNSLGGGFGLVQDVIGAVIGVIVLIGAGKMQRLENYSFALTASIIAMIPCISPCCVLGLPFGIWALVVLNKPEVKSQFT